MRIFSILMVIALLMQHVPGIIMLSYAENPVADLRMMGSDNQQAFTSSGSIERITYPEGKDFLSLKRIIDEKFVSSSGSSNTYQYNCIRNGTLCTSYKYTSIDEKAIKLIVLKNYRGNESFFDLLFLSLGSDFIGTGGMNSNKGLKNILSKVPKGHSVMDWTSLDFGNTLGGDLLEASFGIDFTENASTSTMLGAVEQKVKDLKRQNCEKANQGRDSYILCPYSGVISNIYLPTEEGLMTENIYFDRNSVQIGSLRDEIEYVIIGAATQSTSLMAENYPDRFMLNGLEAILIEEKRLAFSNNASGEVINMNYLTYLENVRDLRKNPTLASIRQSLFVLANNSQRSNLSNNEKKLIEGLNQELKSYLETLIKIGDSITYTLRYKKDSFTLEEAKEEIERKPAEVSNGVYMSLSSRGSGYIPCNSSTNYSIRSECSSAIANARDVSTALGAYFSDHEFYPDTIDKINEMYMPKGRGDFEKNFEYKNTTSGGEFDYEIRYIGHIGEGMSSSGTTDKKDYIALLSGATIPVIPSIFAHIPADSMVLYVKNPANLIELLNQKSNTTTRLSGIDTSESIRSLMKSFFELQNFDQIEKNLKHEMAIVVNNLDATAPDVIIVLSEVDRAALSPTAKARVVGSKDGWIFIASSKDTLERLIDLPLEKSLRNASDFQYVWNKKSALIRDAFVFVGDAFFEKMLTFENYLIHYRKYRDSHRLSTLQELVWSYSDAFGKVPVSLGEFATLGFSSLSGSELSDYSIQDGLVSNVYIGTMKSMKTLPEAHYDLSKITRMEIEDYKYNILKYRDTWRASLDPMGIVLNRYGDGVEVDFFMTPIPSLDDTNYRQFQEFFQGVTKDSLSFITNTHIRSGLFSLIFGFDPIKMKQKMAGDEKLQKGYSSFNTEVLDGKNLLDYIGGEFALSLGDVDPDIFDGWNIEKVDLWLSVQVVSEEKGKELIDLLRTKLVKQLGSSEEMKTVAGFLAKPLIEDYQGKKIYYSEGIALPFVGKLTFAYTFIDDFFIFGLNRPTIKRVIDVAISGDRAKGKIVDGSTLLPGTFYSILFDGMGFSTSLRELYEKNMNALPRFARSLNVNASTMMKFLGTYIASEERNKRLGKVGMPFDHSLGALRLHGDAQDLTVTLDSAKLSVLTGSVLEIWKKIENNPSFPQSMLKEGVSLDTLLKFPLLDDLISLNMIIQLDSAFGGTEALLRNIVFGVHMGDDEIGFQLKVFRDKTLPSDSMMGTLSGKNQELWLIVGGTLLLILLIGSGGIYLYRRSNGYSLGSKNISPLTEVVPSIPSSQILPSQSEQIHSSETNVPISDTKSGNTP